MTKETPLIGVPAEHIAERIFIVRGQKVILDAALAALYGVPTKRLNEQVKRNANRFPADFMLRLTAEETEALNRSQFATGSVSGSGSTSGLLKHRDPRFTPSVFTEHGAIMAAAVLNSPRAVEVSIYVVRAFVQQRELLAANKDLARELKALETRVTKKFAAHDGAIKELMGALRELMTAPMPEPPAPPKRSIGFLSDDKPSNNQGESQSSSHNNHNESQNNSSNNRTKKNKNKA